MFLTSMVDSVLENEHNMDVKNLDAATVLRIVFIP